MTPQANVLEELRAYADLLRAQAGSLAETMEAAVSNLEQKDPVARRATARVSAAVLRYAIEALEMLATPLREAERIFFGDRFRARRHQ